MTHQEQIDEIMDNFDFAKVAFVMEATDWRWAEEGGMFVPNEATIRATARRLLNGLEGPKYGIAARGGFWAQVECGVLSLWFAVDHWDCC